MRRNDFLTCGEHANCAYASPQVQIFTLRSEGVLCGSFDDKNFTESFDKEGWDEL
jgi:hypothetical protein